MGSFLRAARLNSDVPCEIAVFRKGLECPDAGGDHAETTAHEHIPVAHAALLDGVRLHVADQNAVNKRLRCLDIFFGVDRELRLILVQQAAAVLCNDLEELVVGDRLPDTENIVAQRANLFSSILNIILRPIIRRICNASLIEQILVVNQDDIGEALRQAVLLAIHIECAECGFVQTGKILTGNLCKQAFVCIGCEVLDVQLVAVRSSAARNTGLHLREIIIVADCFNFDLDVLMGGFKGFDHFLKRFLIAARRIEVAIGDRHGLCRDLGCGIIRLCRFLSLLSIGGGGLFAVVRFVVSGCGCASCKHHQHGKDQCNQRKNPGLFHCCSSCNVDFFALLA